VPVYDGIFAYIAPLAIFWLLLPVNLRDVLKAGRPMIVLFLLGSLGTALGVVAGMLIIGGPDALGAQYNALGGMFVGTYTGGSVNFNALALNYGMMREGVLFGSAVVVDNIITAAWMAASLALPRLLLPVWRRAARSVQSSGRKAITGLQEDTESIHPLDLGLVLGLGLGAVWISEVAAEAIANAGFRIPSVIVLTLLALICAQIPAVSRLKGIKVLGMFAIYLFLTVIGAFCDLATLKDAGGLGLTLLVLTTVTVVVHGLVTFTAAWLMRIDLDIAAVASQANVGGPASALAVARSFGRSDLVLPGVLLGSLGYALGTFLGFWVAEQWLPLIF
jgi:uncharacterized membrane protein